MSIIVYCSGCRILLQLRRPGATAFRCAVCRGIGHIAAPRRAPRLFLPTTSSYYNDYNHGQKKAVIIGILYKNQENDLKGCINDAKSMKDMLIHSFNFAESSIVMLTGNLLHVHLQSNLRFVNTFVNTFCKKICSSTCLPFMLENSVRNFIIMKLYKASFTRKID